MDVDRDDELHVPRRSGRKHAWRSWRRWSGTDGTGPRGCKTLSRFRGAGSHSRHQASHRAGATAEGYSRQSITVARPASPCDMYGRTYHRGFFMVPISVHRRLLAALAVFTLSLAPLRAAAGDVTVFAAASLADALGAIGD